MRAIDLEARVITAVDQIRSGQQVEHDFIECKRSWPQEDKARQLAGSLNRAAGDPVIYIIGIDEKTGDVYDVSGTDVLNWWAQIVTKFDHTPPEMARHITVPVGEGGEYVVAVAFASDRAPYVVKTGQANPSLEVPMREGTGTRSARRDELLRILIPSVKLPHVVVLNSRLSARHFPAREKSDDVFNIPASEERISCAGHVKLYFEHNGRELVTLPAHGMRGTATVGGTTFEVRLAPNAYHSEDQKLRPQFGVIRTAEAVVVTGPSAAALDLNIVGMQPGDRTLLGQAEEVRIDLELDVLDAVGPLRVGLSMPRRKGLPHQEADPSQLGEWMFQHPNL